MPKFNILKISKRDYLQVNILKGLCPQGSISYVEVKNVNSAGGAGLTKSTVTRVMMKSSSFFCTASFRSETKVTLKTGMWKRPFRQPLPLPLTKNEKTTTDNFFNFCGSVACLLLHFIILRKQKPSFTAITLPTSFELNVLNYSVFLFLRY